MPLLLRRQLVIMRLLLAALRARERKVCFIPIVAIGRLAGHRELVGDYPKAAADALEADLQPLLGGRLVTRMSRHDTNPANNLQVPSQYRL
jgi:hypothetical protein